MISVDDIYCWLRPTVEYLLQDELKRATHCPDTGSRYCVGRLASIGYAEYAPGLAFWGEMGAALGHELIAWPVHVAALPKSVFRR